MKKKMCYRVISAFLAVMMIFTILPLNIFAMGSDNENTGTNISSPTDLPTTNEEVIVLGESETSKPNVLTYVGWEDEEDEDNTISKTIYKDENGAYRIEGPSALKDFAERVNGGETFEGGTIVLSNNIDFGYELWTPAGVSSSAPFMGTFDGECHEIINLNITYDSGKTADSAIHYIGFFGYIKNSTISNFGIYSYKLTQPYNYDTEIGAMVGHAENSNITNCYAYGDISATFEDINPLNRSDCITLTSVPTELNYTNEHGQGVVIDLINASPAINKTMTIKGDAYARVDADVRITGFNVYNISPDSKSNYEEYGINTYFSTMVSSCVFYDNRILYDAKGKLFVQI